MSILTFVYILVDYFDVLQKVLLSMWRLSSSMDLLSWEI